MGEVTHTRSRSWWSVFTVEPDFKRRQILRLLGLSTLNVIASTTAFVVFYHYELSRAAAFALQPAPAPGLLRVAIVWAAMMAALGGIFALLAGLLMTHRMAGTIFHFKRELERIQRGESPQPIGVRAGSDLAGVAEALNAALETLCARAEGDHAERQPSAGEGSGLPLHRAVS